MRCVEERQQRQYLPLLLLYELTLCCTVPLAPPLYCIVVHQHISSICSALNQQSAALLSHWKNQRRVADDAQTYRNLHLFHFTLLYIIGGNGNYWPSEIFVDRDNTSLEVLSCVSSNKTQTPAEKPLLQLPSSNSTVEWKILRKRIPKRSWNGQLWSRWLLRLWRDVLYSIQEGTSRIYFRKHQVARWRVLLGRKPRWFFTSHNPSKRQIC